MNTYLVAHYGNMAPTFSYAQTLDEARANALTLMNSQEYKRNDILSIVNIADDAIVYYGKRDELMAKFNVVNHTATKTNVSWTLSLKPLFNWIGLKLAGPSIG